MDKAEITALLEALCERPLTHGQSEPAGLQAFCREAAKTLSQSAGAGPTADGTADVDRLTAALAVLLSGGDSEDTRRTVENAVLQSGAARLDAQSAIAFVEAIEQSPQAAPADLVEELLAADHAAAASASTRPGIVGPGVWSRLAGRSWRSRRWRMAAAFLVLIAAGGASWTAFLQQTNLETHREPVAKAEREAPVLADAPAPAAPARPALATAQPCEPRAGAAIGGHVETAARAHRPGSATPPVDTACASGNQVADRPAADLDGMMARRRAEAAREAAAARAAAEAAGNIGAAQAGAERNGETFQADPSRQLFGEPGRNPAAAALPAAPPAGLVVRPAAPIGTR